MKLYKVCVFALCLLLARCSIKIKLGDAPEAGAIAPVPRETIPPIPTAAITGDTSGARIKEYAGFWHAGDSVGSGYAARYEFHEDGTFIYGASEMDEEPGVLLAHGRWSISADGANLLLQIDEQLMQGGAATSDRIPLSYAIMKPMLMETHGFQDKGVDAQSGYPVILIDGEPFYRFEDVPALIDAYAGTRKHIAKYADYAKSEKLGSAGGESGLFTMPEDIDGDGKDEVIYYEAGQSTLYLLREDNGAVVRVGEPFCVEAPVNSVQNIRLQGSPYIYVFITQTPAPEATGFALARMLDGVLSNIDTSRFRYDKREDRITDLDLDGVYDGYISEGNGLDTLNMYTLATYGWNAKEELFELDWMSVDIGPYPNIPETAVRKYLALKFMEYGNAEEVGEMLEKMVLTNDDMFDAGLLDGMEEDILSEKSQNIVLRPIKNQNGKAMVEAVIENRTTGITEMITFVMELQNEEWRITGLYVGDNSAN